MGADHKDQAAGDERADWLDEEPRTAEGLPQAQQEDEDA